MQFSPLSEAYGLKKKPKKENMTQVAAPATAAPAAAAPAVPVPSAPVAAPATASTSGATRVTKLPIPAPVASIAGRKRKPRRERRRESFLCRFSEEEKMDLILIMQFLNFAIVMYLLWTRRS